MWHMTWHALLGIYSVKNEEACAPTSRIGADKQGCPITIGKALSHPHHTLKQSEAGLP